MEELSKIIGYRIRGFRRQQGLSQEALAEKCGLHPTYIGQLERGEKNPTVESIFRIARGLEIPVEQLLANLSPQQETQDSYIPDRILCLISVKIKKINGEAVFLPP